VKGQAAVRRNNRKVATLGPGQYFGEMALLDRRPRSASVISDTDMTLLVLGQRQFNGVLDAVPALSRKMLAAMPPGCASRREGHGRHLENTRADAIPASPTPLSWQFALRYPRPRPSALRKCPCPFPSPGHRRSLSCSTTESSLLSSWGRSFWSSSPSGSPPNRSLQALRGSSVSA